MHQNQSKLSNIFHVDNFSLLNKIRQATLEKLIERLTDLRFLSIDFLNTFLLTYRVFTDSLKVLNALKMLYETSPRNPDEIGIIRSARRLFFFLFTHTGALMSSLFILDVTLRTNSTGEYQSPV